MYLFQKIEEMSLNYTDARKSIGEFLLAERSNAANYTMQEIADLTFSSKATLSRFAKKAGYSGWVEFMTAFLEEARYIESNFSNIDVNIPFDKTDNTSELIRKMKTLQTEALEESSRVLDPNAVQRAGEMILRARQIVVFGMRPNSVIAELFRMNMENIGILVHVADTDHGGTVAAALSEKDIAIVVSYSGNNPERTPMRYISTLKKQNVPVISITGAGESYLRDCSDICLTMASREHLFTKIASFSTEESLGFIYNVLFAYCFKKNFEKNYERKVKNSRILEAHRHGSSIHGKDKNGQD